MTPEAAKLELDIADFDVVETIESVTRLVAGTAGAKGLSVVTLIAPGVPRSLRGDAGRLRQVLLNLMINAVKFTSAGTVTVRVSAVPRQATDTAVMLHVEVEDSGVGIGGDPMRLFASFSQARSGTARRYGGTGLGLAICARLADGLGATLGVSSRLGKGSIFRLDVPFAHAAA
jgi:signal transduction histidine kinase